MLTAEDADAYYNVNPDGQVVRFRDILVTSSFSPAVVGETPSKELGHAEPPLRFEEAYSLSASH